MRKKHIIWSNCCADIDLEDWKKSYAEFLEVNGLEKPTDPDTAFYEYVFDMLEKYLDDERTNLNIRLNNPIVVIADLELWNGRYQGYRIIRSGNIADCLQAECDYAKWYVDGYKNLRADAIHHDGTNHYLYREIKDGISDTQLKNFLEKIYDGLCTKADISKYTKSVGTHICDVYGF